MSCGLEGYLFTINALVTAGIFTLGASIFFMGKDYLTKQKLSKPVKTLDTKL